MTTPDPGREGTDKAAAWDAFTKKNRRIAELEGERDREAELRRDAERRLADERSICCDKPEDRLWHAADGTWWRRDDEGRLVRAEPPGHVAELEAERDRLRNTIREGS